VFHLSRSQAGYQARKITNFQVFGMRLDWELSRVSRTDGEYSNIELPVGSVDS